MNEIIDQPSYYINSGRKKSTPIIILINMLPLYIKKFFNFNA